MSSEIDIRRHKNFMVSTESYTQTGVFFRFPIQKVSFDGYYGGSKFDCYKYLESLKNPVRRVFEILIGNKRVVEHGNEWADEDGFAGFSANILCSPVYFKRECRKLEAVRVSCDGSLSPSIESIKSWGYEGEFNGVSGRCELEKTVVTLNNGKKFKFKKTDQYHFTYYHIVQKVLNSDLIWEDIV